MQYLDAISKTTKLSLFVSKANHSTSQLSKPLPQPVMLKELEIEWVHEDLQDLLELTYKKDVLFIIGDLNAEVGSQGTPGVKGKFGIGIQNELGQRLTVLPRGRSDHSKHPLPTTQEKTLHMDIIRWPTLNIFFAAKDGEVLYSQQKQDRELTTAQIMNSLLPNSDWS